MVADNKQDRVAMYWSTWVAPFDGSIKHALRTTSWETTQRKPQTLYSQLMTGLLIVTFPFIKSWVAKGVRAKHANMTEHGSKIEAFYESQKVDTLASVFRLLPSVLYTRSRECERHRALLPVGFLCVFLSCSPCLLPWLSFSIPLSLILSLSCCRLSLFFLCFPCLCLWRDRGETRLERRGERRDGR